MPYFEHKGTRLYYEIEGDGSETIFFAHGFLWNTQMFEEQVEYFKQNYRCVLMDFRGQGLSDAPSSGYDMDSLSDDVSALISNLGLPPVHFVGFSMGGFVAMRMAVNHPEQLKSLCLMNTTAQAETKESRKKIAVLSWLIRIFGIKTMIKPIMRSMFSDHFLGDDNRVDDQFRMYNRILSNNKRGLLKLLKGILKRTDFNEQLFKIRKPALVICADEDEAMSVAQSEQIHKSINGSRFELITECGHVSPIEKPKEVNQLLEQFFTSPYG